MLAEKLQIDQQSVSRGGFTDSVQVAFDFLFGCQHRSLKVEYSLSEAEPIAFAATVAPSSIIRSRTCPWNGFRVTLVLTFFRIA